MDQNPSRPSTSFSPIREKMHDFGVSEAAIKAFHYAYDQVASGLSGLISESAIQPATEVPSYDSLPAQSSFDPALLAQSVVIKLNGGLGTSMGLEKAKSLLKVKGDKTFLDLIASQILALRTQSGSSVSFLLMNSQSTSQDSLSYLASHAAELGESSQLELMQNWAPKLRASDLAPVTWDENPQLEWCPPGHGDLYPALVGSGWLDRLLSEGKRYAFVSNSDNLGAILDPVLLSYFAQSGAPFLMEVTRRTEADKKGGHLAQRLSDGRLLLREVAQCPADDLSEFQNIDKHRYFNTNNLWLDLVALKEVMDAADGVMPLPVIQNKKTVDPRKADSEPVLQLEVAMGAAIESFEGARAVDVPRTRFAPVKSTSDLLALRSDAYVELDNGSLVLSPERSAIPPIIQLSDEYKLVDSLDALGVPSLIQTESLTISGKVSFSENVTLIGKVQFINESADTAHIPSGIYQNENWKG